MNNGTPQRKDWFFRVRSGRTWEGYIRDRHRMEQLEFLLPDADARLQADIIDEMRELQDRMDAALESANRVLSGRHWRYRFSGFGTNDGGDLA